MTQQTIWYQVAALTDPAAEPYMIVSRESAMPHSREWEIDCEMRRLLRKMAEGSITLVERAELHDLSVNASSA